VPGEGSLPAVRFETNQEESGIWGGKDEYERHRMRRVGHGGRTPGAATLAY
jgi:hypothetical protein